MKHSPNRPTKIVVDLQKWKQEKQPDTDKPITYVILGGVTRVDIPTCTVSEFVAQAEAFTKQHPNGFGLGEFAMLLMNMYVMGVRRERAK